MKEEKHDRRPPVDMAGLIGPLWFIGWLFTIGLAKLTFWQAALALIIWPYFLGSTLAG